MLFFEVIGEQNNKFKNFSKANLIKFIIRRYRAKHP
jgi:hypothetical protein